MTVKYQMVASALENDILKGNFQANEKLPTEEELMHRFQVSRNTIRRALKILADEGYVYQVQGSGLFLREFSRPGCITIRKMRGLTSELAGADMNSSIIELSLVLADSKLAAKMKCKPGDSLYYIKRLRFVNGEPLVLEEAYYNKTLVPYLNTEIAESSIYRYITEDLRLKVGFADKLIYCEKLSKEDGLHLSLPEGDPSLVVENTVFLNTGVVFNVSLEKYNYASARLLALTF
ncbi:GntR family transcriptional regulator [Niallia taxi]|uniref:GntR family transcriptional regulator n=1 Tax=Niallia taxi TaxID=2499688 RepID=UPI003981B981